MLGLIQTRLLVSCLEAVVLAIYMATLWPAVASATGLPLGYRSAVAFPLQSIHGIPDEKLELLLDERLQDEQVNQLLKNSIPLDCENEHKAWPICVKTSPRPALLRLLTSAGRPRDVLQFEKPVASLERFTNEVPQQKLFFATENWSAEAGSYNGPITWIINIDRGKIIRFDRIPLMSSLKSAWKVVREQRGREILKVDCRPVYDNDKPLNSEMKFETFYSRIYFDGKNWMRCERREYAMWESDMPFPDLAKFPQCKGSEGRKLAALAPEGRP